MTNPKVCLFGATGNLGHRIARELVQLGAEVIAPVRSQAYGEELKKLGVEIVHVNFDSPAEIRNAVQGSTCVVSALSGTREVIVDLQARILKSAIEAGVPRFIPSDFSIDYRSIAPDENRNLSWRKEFMSIVDRQKIRATTVFNGAFMELLHGQAPFFLHPIKRALCWGDPYQKMDFTTMDDTAKFTAAAALDESSPRYLHISGSRISANELAGVASRVFKNQYKVLRPGGPRALGRIITLLKFVNPAPNDLYPAWQGMQYMRNMYDGALGSDGLDNDRYPSIRFTSVEELLASHNAKAKAQ